VVRYAFCTFLILRILTSSEFSSYAESQSLQPPVAFDDIAFIVHKNNPLNDISRQQVIDIYRGQIRTWKELDWENFFITIINEEQGRRALKLFEKYFELTGKFLRSAIIIGPNSRTIESVAANPHAIAYVSIGAAMVAEAEGIRIKRLTLDGVEPPLSNVKNKSRGLRRERPGAEGSKFSSTETNGVSPPWPKQLASSSGRYLAAP